VNQGLSIHKPAKDGRLGDPSLPWPAAESSPLCAHGADHRLSEVAITSPRSRRVEDNAPYLGLWQLALISAHLRHL